MDLLTQIVRGRLKFAIGHSAPGECAVKMGHNSIVLGALIQDQCRSLADLNADSDYPGVIGPELTAKWFTDRVRELGSQFLAPEPQQIYSIGDKPRYPGSPGRARTATIEDVTILADWLLGFYQEAVPNDPIPSHKELKQAARNERYLFWIVDGQRVSVAGSCVV